jgi:hypothetical protein
VPPVRNHADRNSRYADRHQAAGNALKGFQLESEDNDPEEQAKTEHQKGGFGIAPA